MEQVYLSKWLVSVYQCQTYLSSGYMKIHVYNIHKIPIVKFEFVYTVYSKYLQYILNFYADLYVLTICMLMIYVKFIKARLSKFNN